MAGMRGVKAAGHWGFAQPHPMADAIYSLGRETRGVDRFVVAVKPKGVSQRCSTMPARLTTHPLDIWKNLVPEETPDLDHATDKLVVIDPYKFCVKGDHSRGNQCRCVILQCRHSL